MPSRPPGGNGRALQRAVADDAGAEQRGRVHIVEGVGQRVRVRARRPPPTRRTRRRHPTRCTATPDRGSPGPSGTTGTARTYGAATRCRRDRLAGSARTPRPPRRPYRRLRGPGTTPCMLRRELADREVQVGAAHPARRRRARGSRGARVRVSGARPARAGRRRSPWARRRPRPSHHRLGILRVDALERVDEYLADRPVAEPLVVGGDHVPRRVGRSRSAVSAVLEGASDIRPSARARRDPTAGTSNASSARAAARRSACAAPSSRCGGTA